tara:strand:- start:10006 stop:11856 length:1851 start_codon:yes stop_codon:yes gene_type:complete
MKLEILLDKLNSFEKNAFLKIIDGIIAEKPKNSKTIDNILSDNNRDLKNVDNINIARVFELVKEEFKDSVKSEFVKTTSQLDILIDIIIKDGNCIMSREWFARLYEAEIKKLQGKINKFKKELENEKSDISDKRKRDYKIYKACLETAYTNDDLNNQDRKITTDELSILLTLSQQLGLSQEEVKLINYLIIPIQKEDVDTIINELRTIGVIFYSKKNNVVYVADEVVRILRKLRGKELADKYYRRVLRLLREPQINMVCREHSIDWRLPLDQKIKEIITEGIPFSVVLSEDIHRDDVSLTDKKKFINDFCEKQLKLPQTIKGIVLEEKIENLIQYFEETEKDEKVGISIDGYEKLLVDLGESIKGLNDTIKKEFQLQEENVLKSSFLLDFNIKPRDILELINDKELTEFCKAKEIKTRGDLFHNILEAYKDTENLFIENYENIGCRNLAALKENGILIKESLLGVKFEEITKNIFEKLGFNVDDGLRKKLNTNKDKIDIILNLGNNDLILIECKTLKESGYNKFSSVSRQLKAYASLAEKNDYKVVKSLLIAPTFSDDFISECGIQYDLNLSLITASTLSNIYESFKNSKHKVFPHNLLMRDVLIQEERVIKAIGK